MKTLFKLGLALGLSSPVLGFSQGNGPALPFDQTDSRNARSFDTELAATEEAYILDRKKSTGVSQGNEGINLSETLQKVEQELQELDQWAITQLADIEAKETQLQLAQSQKNALVDAIKADAETEVDPDETEWEGDARRDRIHMRSMALQELEVQIWEMEESWVSATMLLSNRLADREDLEALKEACELMMTTAPAE